MDRSDVIHSASRSADSATNRREAADFEVPSPAMTGRASAPHFVCQRARTSTGADGRLAEVTATIACRSSHSSRTLELELRDKKKV